MKLSELRPNLWLTELMLDDFNVRGAVIVGEKRDMVWDTLSHPRDMQPIMKLAGDKPIDVVYSHADWDHCWGTAGLITDTIIAHETCAGRFRSGDVTNRLAEKKAAEPGLWDMVKLMPPTLTFGKTLSVDLGDVLVELRHLPGHTLDCLVAWIPQWGVLLAGDTVETPLPYLNSESVALLPQWISALEEWGSTARMNVVVPAHGEVGDQSLIECTVNYLRDVQAGKAPTVPANLTTFYSETHTQNQALTLTKT
jgi:glyoxylase-like metal-dependent hydrolase (beta-lactamase superfamily II)